MALRPRLLFMILAIAFASSTCRETRPFVPGYADLSSDPEFEIIWSGDSLQADQDGFHEYWLYGASDSFNHVRERLDERFRAARWKTWPPNSTDNGWDRVIGAIHPGGDFCVVYQSFERSLIYSAAIALIAEDDLHRAATFPSRIFVELTTECA